MLLKKLIKNLSKKNKNIFVKGLTINSKKVKRGFVFFAIKGHKLNGEKFISEAITKGAVAVICSYNCKYKNNRIPIIKTTKIRELLSEICSKFYKLKPKNIIAVTGTNGKTSVSDIFFQILTLNKIPVASIGTLGIKYNNKIIKSNLTSPETTLLHQSLEKLKRKKIDNVIIEASSHGIQQQRIDHINIKSGIFTNFSQDHLDYHKNMKSYLNAKLLLFKKILAKKKTIISDESIKEFSKLKKISKKRNLKLISIKKIKDKLIYKTNLDSDDFRLKNISMAVEAAKLCGLREKNILKSLNQLKDVNGRLEHVKTFTNNIKVFVDFAHTPDALYKVLKQLKKLYGKNISLVFGCGGDRDHKKRPIMGKIASLICKKIYVTDDNPRGENPKKIRQEIITKLNKTKFLEIGNRSKAIKTAIQNAEPNEAILIAGKGHEQEQVYKNRVISISDKRLVKKYNIKIKKLSAKDKKFFQNKKILSELTKISNPKNFNGLAIDSRLVKKDNLFLTIKGKKNDGNKFISNALKKGAKYIISSKKNIRFKNKIINVNNETDFLKNFAFKKRDNSLAKIIAITGSAGKTSLKNLVNILLKNYGKTFCSPKSYNNHFGVPLSLSFLNNIHKFGVFEVGMSRAGEINILSKIIRPHIGIITNIGEAHIENFNSLKEIADAKSEIMNHIENNGILLLNRDDKYFNYLEKKAKSKNLKVVSFGINKEADVYPLSFSEREKKQRITIKTPRRTLNFKIKNINIYNVLSSIALLELLNLDLNKILKYFQSHEPTEGRGKIYEIKRYKKNFKLIDESYNANPLSVKNAIKNFNFIKKNKFKKYLLLGDMLELGKKSDMLHRRLSKVINNSDIDKVFIKGNKTLITYKNLSKDKRGNIFQQEEDVDFTFKNIIANNDYLMIKGSNATGLHNLSKKIIKGY